MKLKKLKELKKLSLHSTILSEGITFLGCRLKVIGYWLLAIGLASCSSDIEPYGATLTQQQPTPTPQQPQLTVSPTTVTLSDDSQVTITVTASEGLSWTLTDIPTWLTVSSTSGTGNGTFTLTANEENPTPAERRATITVSGSGITRQVEVVQAAGKEILTVSATTLSFPVDGDTHTLTVTANTEWSILSNTASDWLTVSKGSDGKSLTLTASENTKTEKREGIVTIKGQTLTDQISVTQEAATQPGTKPIILLAQSVSTLNSVTWSVTSNVSWTVTCPADWISISPTSGTGNGTFTATAMPNSNPTERKTIITVSGSGITVETPFIQSAGAEILEVDATSVNFSADGEAKAVTVTANTEWSISSNTVSDWLTVSKGSDGKSLTLTASENTKTEKREGIVTIKGQTQTVQISVTQEAATPPAKPGSGDNILPEYSRKR